MKPAHLTMIAQEVWQYVSSTHWQKICKMEVQIMYREIDLSEWTLFSARRHSQNYYNADKTQHLKIVTNAAHCSAEEEFKKATLVYKAGVETPKPLELVSCNGDTGIIYEYIKDKKSVLRAVTENPDSMEENMIRWAKIYRKFHDTPCDTTMFSDFKAEVLKLLNEPNGLNEKQKTFIINFLENEEPRETFIIGDGNPSNFIFAGDKDYVIDLSECAYGNPEFDLGKYYADLFGKNPIINFVAQKVLKTNMKDLRKGWPFFINAYYDTDDEEFLDEKIKKLRIYAAIMQFYSLQMEDTPAALIGLRDLMVRGYFKQFIGKV